MAFGFCLTIQIGPANGAAGETHPGAVIFKNQCSSCHGDDGQGVPDKHDEPLFGDRSIESLAGRIERTMPEEEPETCVGEEARQVAEYIYHQFYSLEARRTKGLIPRIQLLRLTVPQYRNAVADLVGRFTPPPAEARSRGRETGQNDSESSVKPGLDAEYYQSNGMNKADKLGLERIDRSVDFDFGEGSPSKDIAADQFAIVWQGALDAKDTGHYEFRVRTRNGARLYLNSENTGRRRKMRDDSSIAGQAALIDEWVSSGEMREHTARVFLLGGRQYPLRLEFFKYKEKTASIRLEWRPPRGVWRVLNHNHVTTARVPRVFVVDTPFPADDRSLGYERGSAVSPAWQSSVVSAAIATATEVINRLPLLAGFEQGDPERATPAKSFVARFAEVAFRRELTNEEKHLLRETIFADAGNPETAVRRAVLLILTSPSFLYTDFTPSGDRPGQYAIAAKLAFALWDSIPDRQLSEAAKNGELARHEQIRSQAHRMVADPRAKAKIRSFFHDWLELGERDLAKDKSMFPQFDEDVIADLRDSLDRFIDRTVWSDRSDYRELLLADYLVLNDRLRELYGLGSENSSGIPGGSGSSDDDVAKQKAPRDPAGSGPDRSDGSVIDQFLALVAVPSELSGESPNQGRSPSDSAADLQPNTDFEPVSFPANRRAGVLTHPYLLSAFAYHNNTSPIHRGVFLTRNIVGRRLKPPPMAVAFKEDEFDPDSTMREKITQLTRDTACMACHSVINPLGFALENYDAVGRWRTKDKDKPVDTKSDYITVKGDTVQIQSARDIANYAVRSDSAHQAFVEQLFQRTIMQNPLAYGSDTINRLRERFVRDNFNIQHLVAEIAVLAAGGDPTETPKPESKP